MRIRPTAVAVATVHALVAGCGDGGGSDADSADEAAPSPTPPLAVEISDETPYTSERNVTVFAPSEGSDWPVVVYFNGGVTPDGYPLDDPNRELLTSIAEQGVVVYAPVWDGSGPNGGSQDSVCAMAFAAETSSDHGGDPDRMTIAGYSAGGYNAVVHGFIADDPPLPATDCAVTTEVDLPRAAVSGGGPFFAAEAARAGLFPAEAWTSLTPEQIDAFDAYLVLDQNPDLTVRLWVGEDDVGGNPERPFPIADSNREYHAALVDAGFDTELVEVPGGHEVQLTERDSFVETIVATAQAG